MPMGKTSPEATATSAVALTLMVAGWAEPASCASAKPMERQAQVELPVMPTVSEPFFGSTK